MKVISIDKYKQKRQFFKNNQEIIAETKNCFQFLLTKDNKG